MSNYRWGSENYKINSSSLKQNTNTSFKLHCQSSFVCVHLDRVHCMCMTATPLTTQIQQSNNSHMASIIIFAFQCSLSKINMHHSGSNTQFRPNNYSQRNLDSYSSYLYLVCFLFWGLTALPHITWKGWDRESKLFSRTIVASFPMNQPLCWRVEEGVEIKKKKKKCLYWSYNKYIPDPVVCSTIFSLWRSTWRRLSCMKIPVQICGASIWGWGSCSLKDLQPLGCCVSLLMLTWTQMRRRFSGRFTSSAFWESL